MTIDCYNQNAKCFYNCTVGVDMSEHYAPFLKHIPDGGHILDAGCGSGRDAKAFAEIRDPGSEARKYKVTAFDASEELVKMAREHSGLDVQCRGFEDVDEIEVYDGVWACASLLHLKWEQRHGAESIEHGVKEEADNLGAPTASSALNTTDSTSKPPPASEMVRINLQPSDKGIDLLSAFAKLATALKPGGVFYCSFKYGDSEWTKDGRLFTDMNGERMQCLVEVLNQTEPCPEPNPEPNSNLQIERMWVTDDMREERDDKWLNCILIKEKVFQAEGDHGVAVIGMPRGL